MEVRRDGDESEGILWIMSSVMNVRLLSGLSYCVAVF